MNPPLKLVMHCTDAGTTSGSPGQVVNRFNLVPLNGANDNADVRVSAQDSRNPLSGGLNIQGHNDEAAALVRGGKRYEVTITELP